MQPELIETILVDAQRRMPLLARHLKRLEASCKALDYAWAGPAVEADILVAALALSAPGPHRLRLLVARDGGRSIQTAPPPLPAVQEVMLAPEALRSSEPLLRYKTTHRPWYTKTIEWLPSHPHLFDLLYLNERGELCEGSRSNVTCAWARTGTRRRSIAAACRGAARRAAGSRPGEGKGADPGRPARGGRDPPVQRLARLDRRDAARGLSRRWRQSSTRTAH